MDGEEFKGYYSDNNEDNGEETNDPQLDEDYVDESSSSTPIVLDGTDDFLVLRPHQKQRIWDSGAQSIRNTDEFIRFFNDFMSKYKFHSTHVANKIVDWLDEQKKMTREEKKNYNDGKKRRAVSYELIFTKIRQLNETELKSLIEFSLFIKKKKFTKTKIVTHRQHDNNVALMASTILYDEVKTALSTAFGSLPEHIYHSSASPSLERMDAWRQAFEITNALAIQVQNPYKDLDQDLAYIDPR